MAKTKAKSKTKTKAKSKTASKITAKAKARKKTSPKAAAGNSKYLQIIINVWANPKKNVLHVRHGGKVSVPSQQTLPAGNDPNDRSDPTMITWSLVSVPGYPLPANCTLTGVSITPNDGAFSAPTGVGTTQLSVIATNNQNGQDKDYKYQLLGTLTGKPINSPDPGITFDGH